MMKQYLSIKRNHPDSILFFRMGDFYEMFMDDAVRAADVLKIALTSRDKGKKNAIPMCGIPFHAAEGYLARLVRAGHKVAICEQVEDPGKARGLVKREVTRTVTPGTAIEDWLLEAGEPSYLASIWKLEDAVGVAVVDVSTGDFRAAQWTGSDIEQKLDVIMAQFTPRELLLPDETEDPPWDLYVTRVEGYRFQNEPAEELLKDFFGVATLAGFGMDGLSLATGAAGAALWYLREVLGGSLEHLKPVRPIQNDTGLVLDSNTLKNLEILRSMPYGQKDGSLLHMMDRTITPQGARLLKEILVTPLREAKEIEKRYDLLGELMDNVLLRGRIREILKGVSDVERILSRISSGVASPRDLVALRHTLQETPGIRELMGETDSDLGEELLRELNDLHDLKELLEDSLVEKPPVTLREAGVIRDGFSDELDELRQLSKDGRRFISELEERERTITGISSLKVGFNKVFGYYIEVTNTHKDLVPESYIRKQTLVNAERFVNQELKEMEERILNAEDKMRILEKELFLGVQRQVMHYRNELQKTASALAGTDVFTALAELAHNSGYCRPVILENDNLRRISISEGRHPVLEKMNMGESFVPNDAYLDGEKNRLLVITGPNMAGKSTFMRQVALIVIMAQAGSFVPAEEALISPVDRVFTRVGATDILSKGLSTFMVEMVEAADILNNATRDSLVILDEIGRGTSTYDGISIAWAVAEYLLDGERSGCRTMFATHYHELTDLALTCDGVQNYNVGIREWGDRLVFLRKVQEGAADKSYGIQVARLAGLPDEVVQRSKRILENLEENSMESLEIKDSPEGKEDRRTFDTDEDKQAQMGLFKSRDIDYMDRIMAIDIDEITPVEALNILAELKKRHG
ncbi:DNA mismatch repair protein MutS [bacterium]|nr:MAG: DNA mismatch repair protein MutS [bacterium]